MAPHHPHDAEDDRQDRLPCREHHRQRHEQLRAHVVIGPQHLIRADPDAVEKARDRAPYEQADRKIVDAVAQDRRRNVGDLRRVAVGPVGGGIAPAVVDDDAVDRHLHAVGEARQEHRPGAAGLLARPDELRGKARRSLDRIARCGEVRQRHHALRAAFGHSEFGDEIFCRRRRQRLPQRQHAQRRDQCLQQEIRDEPRCPPPAPAVRREHRLRGHLAHSLIKPCCTASNTASPRVCTSSLR